MDGIDYEAVVARFKKEEEIRITKQEGIVGPGLEYKDFAIQVDTKKITETGEFEGHGSVFNVLDFQNDIVVPGAFETTLEDHRKSDTLIAQLWQHDSDNPIGIWPEIAEDDIGLKVKGRLLLEVQRGKEAYVLLKAKALGGMSIGYWPVLTEMDEENRIRKLKEIDLWEISLVTFPANPSARVTRVKDFSGWSIRDFEKMLHETCGFSRKQATVVASHGFKGLIPRDAKPDIPALDDVAAALKTFNDSMDKVV